MIHIVVWVLLLLYLLSVAAAIYMLFAHRKYFQERFKKGVVSIFMLAMLSFLAAYVAKMGVAVWIRVTKELGLRTTELLTLQLTAFTIAQLGTTIGLVALAVLSYTKRYDLWIYLRKRDRKGEDKR